MGDAVPSLPSRTRIQVARYVMTNRSRVHFPNMGYWEAMGMTEGDIDMVEARACNKEKGTQYNSENPESYRKRSSSFACLLPAGY